MIKMWKENPRCPKCGERLKRTKLECKFSCKKCYRFFKPEEVKEW